MTFSLLLLAFSKLSYAGDEQYPRMGGAFNECGKKWEYISEFEESANNGDLEAAYCLGLTYEVSGYETYGMNWLKKATEAGHIRSLRAFASALDGQGKTREAAAWFQKGALRNDRLSQGALGHMMYDQWKFQKKEKFLLMSWVWFTLYGHDKFADFSGEEPTPVIYLKDLLTPTQKQKAEKLLLEVRKEISNSPH